MQYFRPVVWVALLLVGIGSFWQAYRSGENGLDDDGNLKVDLKNQARAAFVTMWVGVGSISIGYALFDIFLLFNPLPPSMR
jgi:hypothetical protein